MPKNYCNCPNARGRRIINQARARKMRKVKFTEVKRKRRSFTPYIFALMLILAAMLAFSSCSSHKAAQVITSTDSIRIETRYEQIIVHDTLMVALPHQSAERTTLDSASHIETDYAVSDARINPDGSLTHTLDTKPQEIPVPVTKEQEKVTEYIYRDKEFKVPEPYPVEVERELTHWQKMQMKGFWALLSVLLIAVGWKWRKPIWQFIRRFI